MRAHTQGIQKTVCVDSLPQLAVLARAVPYEQLSSSSRADLLSSAREALGAKWRHRSWAAHILVVRQRVARFQLDDLVTVRRAADVLDAQQIELLLNADVANDVHLGVLGQLVAMHAIDLGCIIGAAGAGRLQCPHRTERKHTSPE